MLVMGGKGSETCIVAPLKASQSVSGCTIQLAEPPITCPGLCFSCAFYNCSVAVHKLYTTMCM